MAKFPLKFEVTAKATPGVSTPWTCKAQDLTEINTCIPVEFNGPGKAYTPEDFFGLAVLNCIIAVVKGNCERNNIQFEELNGKISVNMSNQGNSLLLDHLDITIFIKNASDKEKIKTLIEKSILECPVSNSIKSGKTYHIEVD